MSYTPPPPPTALPAASTVMAAATTTTAVVVATVTAHILDPLMMQKFLTCPFLNQQKLSEPKLIQGLRQLACAPHKRGLDPFFPQKGGAI